MAEFGENRKCFMSATIAFEETRRSRPETLTTGDKRRADRLPLSDPPLTFFITPNLPLSGRKCVLNQLIGRGATPSVSSIIGFCAEILNLLIQSGSPKGTQKRERRILTKTYRSVTPTADPVEVRAHARQQQPPLTKKSRGPASAGIRPFLKEHSPEKKDHGC